ncbi:membrane protein insertase YidC [Sphingosinicella sp. CPCC 101087]|uniref:membrane protein insertase YidC n=1 Tax=Sphingosinicella sp. CPCC 101087 TaxID=2497754 RepID=UPI00101D1DD7|nr:membrane protein insertase YidC [Sphingosinicella sp. CPCC 101087]
MNEHKNMILAIVLSAIVLIGWGFVSEIWFPAANPPVTRIEDGRQVPLPQPGADPAADSPAAIRDRAVVLAETPRVQIETPSLRGSINLKGARIDDLVLLRHREGLAKDSPPVRLFSPAGTPNAYFGTFGWIGEGVPTPGPDTVWQASNERLTPASPVTLSWNNGQGQIFQIELTIDDGYLIASRQSLINRGAAPVRARPYALASRVGPSADPDTWTAHVGPMGVFDGAADYDNDYDDIAEEGEHRSRSRGGWVGFTDKFWLAAVIPDQSSTVDSAIRYNPETNSYQSEFVAPAAQVAPGAIASYQSHLFAGAKEIERLDAYSEALGTPLERAIDWGWFRWFMQAIYTLLNWLFALIGNFGVAIICLTIIVRLLLYPVAQKQFASMAAMRVIQPKQKALQERYKDDRVRMQQEIMKLYKEEKVNPMAGCLPILLQIPIFYALYKVLLLAVEMRHEPFALWIRDLSVPDPLTPVNLFGFLPFQPPALIAVGILPILLGVTMWLQMRLNPQAPDPVQRQVFALMPWVLMFFMAPFAAGLQLYWVTNNILSIGQQRLLYARHPVLKQGLDAATVTGPAPPPQPESPEPKPARSGRRKPKPRSQ